MTRIGRRPIAIALLLVASLLLIPWFGAVHVANGAVVHTAAGSESVTITVSSAFAFSPDYFDVTPGDKVTLTLEQLDSELHTFDLSPVANYTFVSSNTTNDLISFFAAHPPLVSYNFTSNAGSSTTITFTAPPLGTYEYVCLISGHFQAGMHGVMGSGVNVGPPPAAPVPVGLYVITGGIVGLVILAIVLGFVIGQREGGRYEMPPERLGYSEPRSPDNAPGKPPPPFA